MTAQRLLVVVADDAGMDRERNRGILRACREGAVRAVSVIANGPAVEDLADRFAGFTGAPWPDVGLHLNLTEGRALSGPIDGLTDASGDFLDDKRAVWRAGLAEVIDAAAVERETRAQLGRLCALGLQPTFANGHQHVHLLPGVREGLAAALDDHRQIAWVRASRAVAFGASPGASSAWPRACRDCMDAAVRDRDRAGFRAEAAFQHLAAQCGALRAGRRVPDVFAGLDLLGEVRVSAVRDRLSRLEDTVRVVELMTHPGECSDTSVAFSAKHEREDECAALCDPAFVAAAASAGFRLGAFRDAVDA